MFEQVYALWGKYSVYMGTEGEEADAHGGTGLVRSCGHIFSDFKERKHSPKCSFVIWHLRHKFKFFLDGVLFVGGLG